MNVVSPIKPTQDSRLAAITGRARSNGGGWGILDTKVNSFKYGLKMSCRGNPSEPRKRPPSQGIQEVKHN